MGKSRAASSARPLPANVPWRTMGWVAGGLMLFAATCWGARMGWQALAGNSQFMVDPGRLTLDGCPQWVNGPAMAAELRARLSRMPRGESVFSPALAHGAAQALEGSPWVLEVAAVTRNLPNHLQIAAVFRKPAGLVRAGRRTYMVDADGFWLSDELFDPPADWPKERMPAIVDDLMREQPVPGQRWNGPRLAAGVRLSEWLRSQGAYQRLHLATINVTGVGRDAYEPDIVLTTAGGTVIKWGPSSVYAQVDGVQPSLLDEPDAEKLAVLLSKTVDPGLEGVSSIDLRFHGQIVFRRGG